MGDYLPWVATVTDLIQCFLLAAWKLCCYGSTMAEKRTARTTNWFNGFRKLVEKTKCRTWVQMSVLICLLLAVFVLLLWMPREVCIPVNDLKGLQYTFDDSISADLIWFGKLLGKGDS